jgi:hypothetical protein
MRLHRHEKVPGNLLYIRNFYLKRKITDVFQLNESSSIPVNKRFVLLKQPFIVYNTEIFQKVIAFLENFTYNHLIIH